MFLDTLDYLMKRDGINKSVLSKETGIPYTTIDSFYKKGYENVQLSNLRKLCDYFKVSLDFLVGDNSIKNIEKNNNIETESEKTLLSLFRELNILNQAEVIDFTRKLKESEKIERVKQLLYEYQDTPGTAIAYGGDTHHTLISQKQSDIVSKLLNELEEEDDEKKQNKT